MKSPICKVYQACIQFDIDGASTNKAEKFINIICDKALSFSGIDGLDIVTNSGGPCWGPYIEAESKSEASMVGFVTTIETLIESYRGGKVIWSADFRENQNSSTKNCREIAETSTNYPAIPKGSVPEVLRTAINKLFDNDGWRKCYSAIKCHDAHEEIERLLAAAPQPGKGE